SLSASLAALRADRDVYKDELARLADAVPSLADADGPEAVVERALDAVRAAVEPWGALLVAADADGRIELLGGFRGRERPTRGPAASTTASSRRSRATSARRSPARASSGSPSTTRTPTPTSPRSSPSASPRKSTARSPADAASRCSWSGRRRASKVPPRGA